MNKGGKSESTEQSLSLNENKVGDIFPSATLEGYAKSRGGGAAVGFDHGDDADEDEEGDADEDEEGDDDEEGEHGEEVEDEVDNKKH